MLRASMMMILATMLVADISSDNESDKLFNSTAWQEQDPSREALRRMFDKYGERDSGRMTFEGFEHLLESLGLGHIVIDDHDVHDHQSDDGEFHSLHDHHVHNDAFQQPEHHEQHTGVDVDHHRRHKRAADASVTKQSPASGTDISQVRIIVDYDDDPLILSDRNNNNTSIAIINAPAVWNSLSLNCRAASSLNIFTARQHSLLCRALY